MNKSLALIGLIAGINEEDGVGPLSLVPGMKVKCQKDGADVEGEISADENGMIYDSAQDAYCVKSGDSIMWVKSADLQVDAPAPAAEEPAAPAPAGESIAAKFGKKIKKNEAEGEEEPPADGNTGEEPSKEDLYQHAKSECMGMKEALLAIHPLIGAHAPKAAKMMEDMCGMHDQIVESLDAEMGSQGIPGDGDAQSGKGGTEAEPS